MHHVNFDQRIQLVDGRLCAVATAYYKDRSLDVFRSFDDGSRESRNLYYKPLAGYGVSFPGETERGYYSYCGTKTELEPWGSVPENFRPCLGWDKPTESEKALVCEAHPNFRYVLQKADLTISEIFELLPIWKEHPEVELVVAAGYWKLATSKILYRLSKPTLKAWFRVMRENPGKDYGPEQIRRLVKGWTARMIELKQNWRCRDFCEAELRFCEKLDDHSVSLYGDYLEMARTAGKDMSDPYWHFPSDLQKRHDKLVRERRNAEKLKQAAFQAEYAKAVKKWLGKTFNGRDGFSVFVPGSVKEYGKQARALHQCIVSMNYSAKVVKKECVLVFITLNGKPNSTVELKIKGRKFSVGQFYADERAEDIHPTAEARKAFRKWVKKYNVPLAA